MSCQVDLRNAIDSAIKTIEDTIKVVGNTTTSYGENLQLTKERLEKVKELPRAEMLQVLDDMANQELYNNTARAYSGDKIKMAVRRKGAKTYGEYKDVNYVKSSMHGGKSKLTVEVDGKYSTYEFDNNEMVEQQDSTAKVKIDASSSRALHTAAKVVKKLEVEIGREQMADMLISAQDEVRNGTLLGAFKDDATIIDLANRTKVGSIGSTVEGMKDMLYVLHAMGANKASPEYMKHAEGLLGSMHPMFFNKLELFVDEGQGEAAGWVSVDKNAVILDVSTDANSRMTDAEVYMHELIHAMIHWAWKSPSLEANRLRRQMRHVISVARAKTSWESFLPVSKEVATDAEIQRAKDLYEYVFNSEHSEEEFMVHTLTNPVVMKHMQTLKIKGEEQADRTMLQKVVSMFKQLMDIVLGNYNWNDTSNDAYQQVHTLAFKLAEINGKNRNKVETSWLGKADDLLRSFDEKLASWIEKASDRVIKEGMKDYPPFPTEAGRIGQTIYMIKYLAKAMVHPALRASLGAQYFTMVWGMTPENSVREAFNTLLEETDYKKAANWLGLQNTKIDTLRNSVINQTVSDVKTAFSRPMTEAQESAVTEVLMDTNASSMISNGMTLDRFKEVLTNGKELDGEYSAVEAEIKSKIADKRVLNWVLNQADALGYFMATHKGNEALVLNARTIAKNAGNMGLVADIEKMSSLFALKHTSKEAKQHVADLIEQEANGIGAVLDAYESFKNESRSVLFKNDDVHMIDGYSKEVFDDTMEIKVVPIKDRQKMEEEGFVFKGEVETPAVAGSGKYGLFVTESYSKAERLRGAINLGNTQSRGTSLREMVYREIPWDTATNETDATALKKIANSRVEKAVAELSKKAVKLQQDMSAGRVDVVRLANGVVPVLDAAGKIVDYRTMMSKQQKKELLKQNTAVSEVLARSMGSIIDKSRREAHNLEVLKLLKEDMENNWDGKEFADVGGITTEYRLIGPNSSDPKMKELYYMLPDSFKQYIQGRDDKTLAVPAELMNILFGYHHLKFTDIKYVRALPKVVKKILDMVESYFIDLVKIVKSSILLKMPVILISNIVSNVIYAFNAGMNPMEILKFYIESFADVKQFMNDNRQKIKLELELRQVREESKRTGKDREKRIKNIEEKLHDINNRMNDNPVKELFDLGMYQSVVEDVETSKLNDTNKVTDSLDKVLNVLPGVVSTPLKWLYLSKDTAWYKVNQEVLQMSDLIARDVMNRKQKLIDQEIADGKRKLPKEFRKFMFEEKGVIYPIKGQLQGSMRDEYFKYAKQSREYNLLKTFINYNQPNGRLEEYLNRIGLLMFTKYVKNIQRVIVQTGGKHPIRTALTVLAAGAFLNADYIQEQAFAVKGFGYDGEFGITNIFPVYNPIGNVIDLINPPLVKLVF